MSNNDSSPARASRSATRRALQAVVPPADQLAPGAVPVNMTASEAAAEAAKRVEAAREAGEEITESGSRELIKQIYIFNPDEEVSDELKSIHAAGCEGAEELANASKQQLASKTGKLAVKQHEALKDAMLYIKKLEQHKAHMAANTAIRVDGASSSDLQAVLEAPTADKAQKIAQEKRLIAEQRALAAGEAQHAAANEGQEARVARLEADLAKATTALMTACEKTPDKISLIEALAARVTAITKEVEEAKGDAAVTGVQASGEALQQQAQEGLEANAAKKQRTRSAEAEASGLAAQAALGADMQNAPKAHLPSGAPGASLVPLDQLQAIADSAEEGLPDKPTRGKGSGKKAPRPKDDAQKAEWKEKAATTRAENKRVKEARQRELEDFYNSNGGEEVEELKQKNKKLKGLLKKTSDSREELQDKVQALEARLEALEAGDPPPAAPAAASSSELDLKIEKLQLELKRQKKHNVKLCNNLIKANVATKEQIQVAFDEGKKSIDNSLPIPDHLAGVDMD